MHEEKYPALFFQNPTFIHAIFCFFFQIRVPVCKQQQPEPVPFRAHVIRLLAKQTVMLS